MRIIEALRRPRRGSEWSPLGALLLGPLLTVLIAIELDLTLPAMALALTTATALSVSVAGFLERRMDKRGVAKDAPAGLDPEALETWSATLRNAVVESRIDQGGQLDQMVRDGEVIEMSTRLVDTDARRPRLRIGGQLHAWSAIKREWDNSEGRLVILGAPGYGKTVAALTVIAHINAERRGAAVAELFSLADWYRWQSEHPDQPLAAWLAEELALSYRELPRAVSRQLVEHGLVLPVLDGLDEVPTVELRRTCAQTIEGYARRVAPHRPFVLTCRLTEYTELSIDWVSAEQVVLLAGLQPDQIAEILKQRTAGRAGWEEIRSRIASGEAALSELFRSPLRLAIALRVYRDRDPSDDLHIVDIARTRAELWDLLLSTAGDGFRGATQKQVRDWLTFLAEGMRRTGRQSLMLHELHLVAPERVRSLARFRGLLGLVTGLGAMAVGAAAFWEGGLSAAVPSGLGVGFGVALSSSRWSPAPSTRVNLGWRARLRRTTRIARIGQKITAGLMTGGFLGLVVLTTSGDPKAGLIFGLGGFVAMLLLSVMDDWVSVGTEIVAADPPARFTRKRPDGLLIASRNSGLRGWFAGALAVAAMVTLALSPSTGPIGALENAALSGLAFGVAFGLRFGLGAWLYHHWLRRRLRKLGLLPRRLPEFLAWCAEPSRGWLRITNAYEFRHRELLDHLAPVAANRVSDP